MIIYFLFDKLSTEKESSVMLNPISDGEEQIGFIENVGNKYPETRSPEVHEKQFWMTLREWLPCEGEVSVADLVSDVQENGIHTRVEEWTSRPHVKHVDEQIPEG